MSDASRCVVRVEDGKVWWNVVLQDVTFDVSCVPFFLVWTHAVVCVPMPFVTRLQDGQHCDRHGLVGRTVTKSAVRQDGARMADPNDRSTA